MFWKEKSLPIYLILVKRNQHKTNNADKAQPSKRQLWSLPEGIHTNFTLPVIYQNVWKG